MMGKIEGNRLYFKVVSFVVIIATFLSSCTSSTAALSSSTPVKTTEPACKSGICVNDVYLQIMGGDTLLIQFDLANENDEVNFGEELEFKSKITFALFLIDSTGDDIYLAGMNPELSQYSCYSGNDIPWSNGHLAATCGIAIPINIFQVHPNEGDPIRVEIIDPKFETTAKWLQSE